MSGRGVAEAEPAACSHIPEREARLSAVVALSVVVFTRRRILHHLEVVKARKVGWRLRAGNEIPAG